MSCPTRCSDLSERTRRLLITDAVTDGAQQIAVLIDIQRRPASHPGPETDVAAVVTLALSAKLAAVTVYACNCCHTLLRVCPTAQHDHWPTPSSDVFLAAWGRRL